MGKLATSITIVLLAAAAACTQPPGEDGGGNTGTFAASRRSPTPTGTP